MSGYELMIPEILLLVGALVALFLGGKEGRGRSAAWVGVVCAVSSAAVAVLLPVAETGPFGTLVTYDDLTRVTRVSIAALTAVWLLWTAGRGQGRTREAVVLALFAALGAMLLCEAQELITAFVAIELATLPVYVLIGYCRSDIKGLEGALKYFLLSMLTSLVMLYGFSFLYGLTGTTHYAGLDLGGMGALGVIAAVLALVGVLAKLSAVPFHFWAPDAYEAAPAWIVAFASTVPKIGGAVAIGRLVLAMGPGMETLALVIGIVSAASMILGNLVALPQTDVRRLMAYSAIAHTGYLLLGIVAMTGAGVTATVIYAAVYSFATMGVLLVSAEEGPLVSDFGNLVDRRPVAAWGVVVMLLSLIGIPPLAGFFGKLTLFASALESGQMLLVILAIVMSVVSVAYYMKIVKASFFGEESHEGLPPASKAASLASALCVFAVVVIGLGFGIVLQFAGGVV